jgi:leucine dehydrogenase
MTEPTSSAAPLSEPELIYRIDDEPSGLVAFVVLHDLSRGPALGGVRFRGYESEDAARDDAIALARQMSWKTMLAEMPGGGGKAVVMADRLTDRQRACLVMGAFIEYLGGKFLSAGDLGATTLDLEWMASRTRFLAEPGVVGDLGDATALGLMAALREVARSIGVARFSDLTVAVQGLGSIGLALVRRLLAAGVTPFVADVDPRALARAHQFGAVVAVLPEQIARLNVDVLAPCAIGGVIDHHVAETTPARAIVGGANRILASPLAGATLHERGILYVPDFVTNAGAVIRGGFRMLRGFPGEDEEIERIGARVGELLEASRRERRSPESIATERAEQRIATARGVLP